jgi:hypothetical protein
VIGRACSAGATGAMTGKMTGMTGKTTGATAARTGATTGATGAMTGKTAAVAVPGCSGNRELDNQGRGLLAAGTGPAHHPVERCTASAPAVDRPAAVSPFGGRCHPGVEAFSW